MSVLNSSQLTILSERAKEVVTEREESLDESQVDHLDRQAISLGDTEPTAPVNVSDTSLSVTTSDTKPLISTEGRCIKPSKCTAKMELWPRAGCTHCGWWKWTDPSKNRRPY